MRKRGHRRGIEVVYGIKDERAGKQKTKVRGLLKQSWGIGKI